MYAEYLRQSACDIDEAQDGREALAKALSRRPDIIVTETRLSGINGFDLCQLLRNDAATSDIPVVFVTGDASPQDVKRAESAGADAVLVKPCLPERLANEITRLLTQSRELRARARAAQARVGEQFAKSQELVERSHTTVRRVMLSHAYERRDTTEPPTAPPVLVCPSCDQPLKYLRSHIGGVSERHQEQWDYFECPTGCGTFQYRHRTRKLRHVE
jgi:CheY-like chemotaxis protein